MESCVNESLHPGAPDHLPTDRLKGDRRIQGFVLHAVGIVHAMLLRVQARLLPIKTLALGEH